MSEYWLGKYRPIADRLLGRHSLDVDVSARDLLANTIAHSRELPRNDEPRSASPIPAREAAKREAAAVVRYLASPPQRNSSLPLRCKRLLRSLQHPTLAAELAWCDPDADPKWFGGLLDALESGKPAAAQVNRLTFLLESVPDGEWQRLGRPWSHTKLVVRAGCIAWTRSGRPERFTWREDLAGQDGSPGALQGPLPDFLRDLITCCTGTAGKALRTGTARLGDGIRLSDKALQQLILGCKKSGLL